MSNPKDALAERLKKAGIDPVVFADLLWPLVKEKIVPMMKEMAKQHAAKRQEILTAALSGLSVKWAEGSAQHIAELAERITEAVMREEEKRTQ